MPAANSKPTLVGGIDLRAWAEVLVMTIGGQDVTLGAEAEPGDLVVQDLETALNGRGSGVGQSLPALLDAKMPGLTAGIDATTGRWYFEANDGFTIEDTPVLQALGYPPGDLVVVAIGLPPYRSVAPSWFGFNPIEVVAGLNITPDGSPMVTAAAGRWWPSAIAALRERGSGDEDDLMPLLCIEQAAHDSAGDTTIRTGLVTDRITVAWDTSGDLDATIAWPSPTFRNALGFTGNETVTLNGSLAKVTADRPSPKVLLLHDGLIGFKHRVFQPATAIEAEDGVPESNSQGRLGRIAFRTWVGGGDHPHDLHRHWQHRVRPAAGEPLNLYLNGLARPRRNLDPYDAGTVDQPAHDLVRTVGRSADGYGGRFIAWMEVDVSEEEELDFGATRQKRAPVDLVLATGAIDAQ